MIKFSSSTKQGAILFGFGISRANLDQLVKGNPIQFALNEMGYDGVEVLIFFGETEEQMQKDMQEFIDEETIVIDRKKGVEN